jgi:electron transfer flavoprotein alpha subunit
MGLAPRENLRMVDRLANKPGAAVDASRAAVDSAGSAPNDWRASSLAGMKDTKFIVASNKEEEAPIF